MLVEKFKSVFVSPDRSIEQRINQRELINDMRKRKQDAPDKRHFISGRKQDLQFGKGWTLDGHFV
jgi:hypothetical protein